MLPTARGSKGRVLRGIGRTKLGLPVVVLSCSLFFVAGFFGSMLFTQDLKGVSVPRSKLLEVTAMPHGETGEPHPLSIEFQVLSWKPRALYFPKFATAEQCHAVVKLAKSRMKPSTLALRKGETADSTKGIRTRFRSSITCMGSLQFLLDQIVKPAVIQNEFRGPSTVMFKSSAKGPQH